MVDALSATPQQPLPAALVVAATAGAAAPVTAIPPAPAVHTGPATVDPGTSPSVPSVPAGTGGLIRVMLVGDSEASFLGFGLGPAAPDHGVFYAGDGVFGCGLTTNTTRFHGGLVDGSWGQRGGHDIVSCRTQLARWQTDVDTYHPDVVLVADGEYEVRDQRTPSGWAHIGTRAFDAAQVAALTRAVAVLHSGGATVGLLTAPYYHQLEQADGNPWPEDDPARVNRYNALLRQVAAASHGAAVVIDLGGRLDPGGRYTATIDGVQVRFSDGIHVSQAGAALVAPWLLTQVADLGRAARATNATNVTTTTGAP